MSTPQFGIFAQGTVAHYFLEFDLRPGLDLASAVDALRQLRQPAVSAGAVNLVIAFGASLWRQIAPYETPSALRPFTPVTGPEGRSAPATQRDVWLWIHGSTPDVVFEHARAAALVLKNVAILAAEQPCFVHRDSRDLTGFIDGTANPQMLEAPRVALVPPGEVGEGGSYLVAMRWVHNLEAFERLPVKDEERVFGRTKVDSIELEGDAKPPSAHIARVEIHDATGEELPIYRRSVPYGTVAEHGLYFVAFSRELSRFDVMLARMFGAAGDGLYDRLTDFSRPVSGAYYFAPSLTLLSELAESGLLGASRLAGAKR
jgi:putative iron-dependent peroxidase